VSTYHTNCFKIDYKFAGNFQSCFFSSSIVLSFFECLEPFAGLSFLLSFDFPPILSLLPKKVLSLLLTLFAFGFGETPATLWRRSGSESSRSKAPFYAYASITWISSFVTLAENFFNVSFLFLSSTESWSHSMSSYALRSFDSTR